MLRLNLMRKRRKHLTHSLCELIRDSNIKCVKRVTTMDLCGMGCDNIGHTGVSQCQCQHVSMCVSLHVLVHLFNAALGPERFSECGPHSKKFGHPCARPTIMP